MIDVKERKMEMETMTKGVKVKRIQLTVTPQSIKMPKYPAKAVSVVCPCNVSDVYSMGITLQKYLGNLYAAFAEQLSSKNDYENLAQKQLGIKNEIEQLARENMNELLSYFYDNGGPVIEPLVSEQSANEIQPFINRTISSFVNRVDFIINRAAESNNVTADDIDNEINKHMVAMYNTMHKFFADDAMKNAFDELIRVRNA